MIEKAILKINPNAEFSIEADDVNQITWLNGTTPISNADIQAKITEIETNEENEKQAKADLKLSAKTKLMNGEALTEDEANVMVGL
jgi:hypothetical protein